MSEQVWSKSLKAPRVAVYKARSHLAPLLDALHGFLDDPLLEGSGSLMEGAGLGGGEIENGAIQAIINGRENTVRGWLVEPTLLEVIWEMMMNRPVKRERLAVGWSCALRYEVQDQEEHVTPFWLVARCCELGTLTIRLKDGATLNQARFDVWVDGLRDRFTVREDGEVVDLNAAVWTPERQVLLSRMIAQVRAAFALEGKQEVK